MPHAHHPSHADAAAPRRLGYIGLGIMGSAMAANLLKAGYEVHVWNRTASRMTPLEAMGAKTAMSPADLAQRELDGICINVTDTPDVLDVIFGETGLAKSARPGLVVIDHSTISPQATADAAARLASLGVTLLDAPVSGGDVGARAGTLSIMVGGDEAAHARFLPVFQAMGKTIAHLGPSGAGQICKACNQIAVAMNLAGVVEAMALAAKSGIDPMRMVQVVAGGGGASWQLDKLGPKIARGDHAPGFMIDLILKDLAIVQNAARELKLPLLGVSAAEAYFRAVVAADPADGKLGTQAVAKAVERLGNFSFAANAG